MEKILERTRKKFMEDFRKLKKSWSSIKPYLDDANKIVEKPEDIIYKSEDIRRKLTRVCHCYPEAMKTMRFVESTSEDVLKRLGAEEKEEDKVFIGNLKQYPAYIFDEIIAIIDEMEAFINPITRDLMNFQFRGEDGTAAIEIRLFSGAEEILHLRNRVTNFLRFVDRALTVVRKGIEKKKEELSIAEHEEIKRISSIIASEGKGIDSQLDQLAEEDKEAIEFLLSEEVNIPDTNLEALIREKLEKPEGPITASDLESITTLDSGHDRNTPEEDKIADITGLGYCTNLTEVNLNWNQITEISSLSNLTNLTQLHLMKNQIKDISPLSNFTNLTWLGLGYNQISNLQSLVDNPGIDSGDGVRVYHNPLSYISQKEHIPALEERGVEVDYDTKGKVTLDSANPPAWSYTLTYQDGEIYNFFYEGVGITDARVTGEAEAAGWTVEFSSTLVTFANDIPLEEGEVRGFEITGTQGGTGSWLCGRGSGEMKDHCKSKKNL